MKKLLIYAFSLLSLSAFAENKITTPLPAKCTAYRPDALYEPIFYQKTADQLSSSRDFGQKSAGRSREYWIVFSDRDHNPTYVAPGSTTVHKYLSFNEKVRIAKIERGYALVYSEPREQETYPNISSNSEWKGWIPMSKLLLWSVCPCNEKGIYNKAMLCANIDQDLGNGSLGKLFLNPSDTDNYATLSVNFNYYFVMKREGNMVLLANQNSMNGDSYKVLYGWVDKNSYVEWNQRSCLEPTWDVQDVEFFASRGTKVNIFEDKNARSKASYITFTKKNSADGGISDDMYRMTGETLRYPLLDDSTSKLWNCSTFSSSSEGYSGPINAGTTEKKKSDETLKFNLDELSKIRIGIVIDGTKSMEKYFPAVRDAIKEFSAIFRAEDNVKVGVVIFRDKMDGDFATEVFPMTNPDNPQLADFLNNGGKYGIKSHPKDRSLEEALYLGVDKALDAFRFNPKESNMLFVIGDCGNSEDYPEITKDVIVEKLVSQNVTLMGFQVRNDSRSGAFTLFNNNVCELIKESLQGKFRELDESVSVKVQFKGNSVNFNNNAVEGIENTLYIGSHKRLENGTLPATVLVEQLEAAVINVKSTIEHQREIVVDIANGVTNDVENKFGGNNQVSGPMLDQAWFVKRVGKEYAESLRKTSTTVSFKGFTPKEDSSSGRSFYKTVIFISQQELNTMMTRLEPLYQVAQKKGNDREPYVLAMKTLVQSMLPGLTDAEINAMGYDEVMGLIAGLNASTISLKGRTIAEVASPQVVNATEYQSIIAKFKRQYQKLQRIQKTPYAFVREFNGAKYYWIPTEDLP